LSPSEQLAARALHPIVVVSLAWVGLWYALVPRLPKLPSALLSVSVGVVLLVSLGLLWRGHVRTATWVFIIALWCWGAVMAVLFGGIHSVALISFVPGFVTAAILLGKKVAMWSALGFLVFTLSLAVMEMTGLHVPRYAPLPPLLLWIGVPVTGLIAALPLNELLRFLRESLDIVQRQLDALRSSGQSLRESEARYRAILESVRDGIVVADAQTGQILSINPAAERLAGNRIEELQSLLTSELGRAAPRDFSGLVEAKVTRSEGDSTPVELSSAVVPLSEDRRLLVGVFRDVSERKAAELERSKLEDRIRQAQRLETVGRLAGGVAHDFNNLLTVINGFSRLVLDRLPPGDANWAALEEIRKAGDRAAALTRQLLAFSRKQIAQPKPLDLNVLLADMQPMLRSLVSEEIELLPRLATALPSIEADPIHMHQVVVNLVTNARDAMPKGGKLIVETAALDLDSGDADAPPDLGPGLYVVLSVSDDGEGMDETVRRRLFEPFFTTKEVGKGTGLGLSTVYGIVQQSRGAITVDSQAGKGSTFRVYLPAREAPVLAGEPASPDPLRGWETILVVEDQDDVRKLIVQILRAHGYRVLEAANGYQALDEAARHPEVLHLMITDVVMPGMRGPELARRLASVHPGTRVLFTSGYSEARGGLESSVPYIAKPFTADSLAGKVREVLAGEIQEPDKN
jgi:two-component system, cell cycle sensor histidine kinase and response regulator CckA